MQLTPYIDEIREEIKALCSLRFTEDELAYMRNMRFIKSDFIDFLRLFRLNEKHVEITPLPTGEIDIRIVGPWLYTILFEIPVLAIVSEELKAISLMRSSISNGVRGVPSRSSGLICTSTTSLVPQP